MMASSWSTYHFLIQRSPLQLSYLVMTLTTIFSVTESVALLTGEVGGNVTFNCSVEKQRPLEFLYLQKGKEFVNGYHASKQKLKNTWENTRFNLKELSVFMDRLNLSHSGEYSCHIRYKDNMDIVETAISLTVTAKYSIPLVTAPVCNDENHVHQCQVTCASHGGYPRAEMVFTVAENTSSQIWRVVNSRVVSTAVTMLFNSSSTAIFNCSNGEVKFICSIGDVTSNEFSVCVHQEQHNTPLVTAAAICVVVVVAVIVVVLCWRRWTGTAPHNVRPVRVTRNEEVAIALNEKNGEKEAA